MQETDERTSKPEGKSLSSCNVIPSQSMDKHLIIVLTREKYIKCPDSFAKSKKTYMNWGTMTLNTSAEQDNLC